MFSRGRITLGLVTGLVTVSCVVALGGWLFAQGVGLQSRLETPIVLAGSDVGFRVESRHGNTPSGKLVVRIDGQWVEAQFAGGVVKLGGR